MNRFKLLLIASLPCLLLVSGCGGPSTTTVKGKVKVNDQPVTGGMLTFGSTEGEEPGKPASGDVQSDGTFSIENVIVGKNVVLYSAPNPPEDAEDETPSPYEGYSLPPGYSVEVKPEGNDFNLELQPIN